MKSKLHCLPIFNKTITCYSHYITFHAKRNPKSCRHLLSHLLAIRYGNSIVKHSILLTSSFTFLFQWLPILNDGKLNVGEFMLPVMVEQPPENYSYIPPDVQLPGTKWLDNHRPVFTVTIDAVTSVHTLNPFLNRFINLCEYLESRKIPPRIGESNIEREMKKALLEIQQSELEPLVKNLVVILDKLIELLVTMFKIGNQCLGLASTVFETICLVSNKLAVSLKIILIFVFSFLLRICDT